MYIYLSLSLLDSDDTISRIVTGYGCALASFSPAPDTVTPFAQDACALAGQ